MILSPSRIRAIRTATGIRAGRWGYPATLAALLATLVSGCASPAGAQFLTTAAPSVIVIGVGAATAPAESATVQLLIGRRFRSFGFSEDGSGGGSFASGGAAEENFVAALVEAGAAENAATPTAATPAGERQRGRGAGRPEKANAGPITAAELAPIADAVGAAAAIDPGAIDIDLSPLATQPFGERSQSALLEFESTQPTPEGITGLIIAASDAASPNGLVVEVAGVRYNPADCDALETEAERAAIADARDHADRLAEHLGVALGGIIGASQSDYYRLAGESNGCGNQDSSLYDSRYGGLEISVPVFHPTAEAEITVSVALSVAFAIVGDATS